MELLPEAGYIGPQFRRDDGQETAPESHTGLQGEGGLSRRKGGEDARRT